MVSKFSSYGTSPNCTDDHNASLPHSPCVGSSRYFPLDIPNPCSAIQRCRPLTATTVPHCSSDRFYPFMKLGEWRRCVHGITKEVSHDIL